MHYYRFVPIFVISVLIGVILYPLSVVASSHKEEHAVESENKNNDTHKPHSDDKKSEEFSQEHKQEHSSNQDNSSVQITQTGPDEGDSRHPSGKDRSEEHGKSEPQGRSHSDPDGKENIYGGSSGKDKIGFDGGLDKGDQDGNNGCGNDDDFEDDNNGNCGGHKHNKVVHPPKNEGGCDANGSTGDKNGKPCDPGKNNAGEFGCLHGEPDCNEKNEDPKEEPKEKEKETSHEENQTHISIVINVNNHVNSQQSTQPTASQVLAASTLAATGDSLFKLAVALILMGTSSLIFGLLFLFRKAINKVFNRGYQSYLYLYEA